MKYIKKYFFSFLFITILLTSCIIGIASKNYYSISKAATTFTPRIVKVGITNAPYFSTRLEDGSYTGIMIDYLQEISKYTGWKLEYIECSLDESIKKLETGEVDIVDGILKNEYSLDRFDFATYSSGYSYTILSVLKENNKYLPLEYNTFNGMNVGIFKSSNRISDFNEFVKTNNLNINSVYFDTSRQLQEAFLNGTVDAILTNDTSITDREKVIAKFGEIPYYFAVTKGNSELLKELNIALSTIREINPNFDDIIYAKYFNNTRKKLTLNQSEKAFIQNNNMLKVAIISTLTPIEYFNPSSKKAEGISPDILALIASRTGLKFEFIPVDSFTKAKELLQKGEVDLIAGLDYTDIEKDTNIVFSRQYLSTQKIMIQHSKPKKGKKNVLAVLDGYFSKKTLGSYHFTVYETPEECIQAVISGNAEYTYMNNLITDYYTYLRGNEHITLTPAVNATNGLCFGLSQLADPNLLSILDKAIYSLTQDEIQSILYENTTADSAKITLTSLLYTYPTAFTLICISIFLVLFITIISLSLYIRTKLKLTRQIALRGDSYRIISELINEYIYDYDFETGILTLPEAFVELVHHENVHTTQHITSENNEIINALYSTFYTKTQASQTTVEFKCPISENEQIWFKAIGTVILDSNHKPLRGIGRIKSIQNEKDEKQELEVKATTDSLTKLYNRQFSEQKIIEYFNLYPKQGALMLIDLDYFKKINDTLGHIAGDEVLLLFSKTLVSEFCKDSIIGRWGGDEFIVFIKDTADEKKIGERAYSLCKQMNYEFHYKDKSHILSISIGISMSNKASSYLELFQNADLALYDVKNAQRNGFKIF